MQSANAKAEELLDFIYSQPLHREIYYKVLGYCKNRRSLSEIEQFIMDLPEYKRASQSPFFLIRDLHDKGGLDLIELDEAGNEVHEEDKIGLDEDEIDDLVVSFAYECNDVGNAAADLSSTEARLQRLLDANEQDSAAFIALMNFLEEKKSIGQIDRMLVSWLDEPGHSLSIPANIIVDRLEKAGVIYWDKGWILTKEGEEALSNLKVA